MRYEPYLLQEKKKKGRWSDEETAKLKKFIEEEQDPGNPNWTTIEEKFGGMRSAKQIRERWSNHINPQIVKRSFSKEEVVIIEAEFASNKFKWAKIAAKLENATPLMVKNFWNNRLKRNSSNKNGSNPNEAPPKTFETPPKTYGFPRVSSLPRVATFCSMMSMSSNCSTDSNRSNGSAKSRSRFLKISSLLNFEKMSFSK